MQRLASSALVFGLALGASFLADAPVARAACGGPGSISVSPPAVPDGTLGVPYEQTFEGSTYPGEFVYVVLSGALPDGLSLATDTGVLSGTPTYPGEFSFQVHAYIPGNETCNGTTSYTMSIEIPDGGVWVEPDAGAGADAGGPVAPDAGPTGSGGGGGGGAGGGGGSGGDCSVGARSVAGDAAWLAVLGAALLARPRLARRRR